MSSLKIYNRETLNQGLEAEHDLKTLTTKTVPI